MIDCSSESNNKLAIIKGQMCSVCTFDVNLNQIAEIKKKRKKSFCLIEFFIHQVPAHLRIDTK